MEENIYAYIWRDKYLDIWVYRYISLHYVGFILIPKLSLHETQAKRIPSGMFI